MRQMYDFAPLFGSTVGFDRVFDLLQSAGRGEQPDSIYPPYDIERTGPDGFRIVLAVAGFGRNELSITAERNLLAVEGKRGTVDQPDRQHDFLHRGIGARPFKRAFQLADHVKVVGAELADGLLTIDLLREIPEVMRPRQIEIAARLNEEHSRQIEAKAA